MPDSRLLSLFLNLIKTGLTKGRLTIANMPIVGFDICYRFYKALIHSHGYLLSVAGFPWWPTGELSCYDSSVSDSESSLSQMP